MIAPNNSVVLYYTELECFQSCALSANQLTNQKAWSPNAGIFAVMNWRERHSVTSGFIDVQHDIAKQRIFFFAVSILQT